MHIIYNWSNSAKRINRSIAQRVTSTKQKKLSHSFIGPGGRGRGGKTFQKLSHFTVQLHLQCERGWGVKFPLLHFGSSVF